jgi:hypothetical protein
MRRISTGLTRVGFDQDPSPLTEGMLNAASTLGELWPRLKQIEADKQQRKDSLDERNADRATHDRYRAEDVATRKQERADSLSERTQLQKERQQDRADALGLRKQQFDQQAKEAEYRDLHDLDVQAQQQRALWSKNDAKSAPRDWDSAWRQAKDEIGDPDGDTKIVMLMTPTGEKKPTPVKTPLSPQERQQRVDRLNSRTLELTGHQFQQIPLPPETEPLPVSAPVSQSPQSTQLWPTGKPSIGSGQEQAKNGFMAGAGGWGTLMPTAIAANNGAPSVGAVSANPNAADPAPNYVSGLAEMSRTNPGGLKSHLLELKASNPAAYQATVKQLREIANAQP